MTYRCKLYNSSFELKTVATIVLQLYYNCATKVLQLQLSTSIWKSKIQIKITGLTKDYCIITSMQKFG